MAPAMLRCATPHDPANDPPAPYYPTPLVSVLIDAAEHAVLADMSVPKAHWAQYHSTSPIERRDGEAMRAPGSSALLSLSRKPNGP